MNFKNRTFLASLATTLGVVMVAGLGFVALGAQQGPGQRRGFGGPGGPGGQRPGMFAGRGGRGPMAMTKMRGPMAGMMMRGLGQLNLSDDQKTQFKGVLKANAPKVQALRKEMMAAREALGDAITADSAATDDISAKAAAVAAIELRGALLRADVHKQVLTLLTPEQKAKAKELRAEGKGRMQKMLGRGMRRGMGRGGRGPGGAGGIGGWF